MATTPASSNPDTLVLTLSEDAYKGDAQFSVTLDGASLGAAQTVTASHAAGAQQPLTFTGNWGAGPHSVSVKYLNDAYGGISATDRNLFLMSATYDGQAYANVDKGMYSAGETAQVTVQAPGQGGSTAPTSAPASASIPAKAAWQCTHRTGRAVTISSGLSGHWMAVPMVVRHVVHHEAAAGQRAVPMRHEAAPDMRQALRRLDDRRAMLREGVEQAGDEHVARRAAKRMKVDVPRMLPHSVSGTPRAVGGSISKASGQRPCPPHSGKRGSGVPSFGKG